MAIRWWRLAFREAGVAIAYLGRPPASRSRPSLHHAVANATMPRTSGPPPSRLWSRQLGTRARALAAVDRPAETGLQAVRRLLAPEQYSTFTFAERERAQVRLRSAAPSLSDAELSSLDTAALARLLGACALAPSPDRALFVRAGRVLGDPARLRALDAPTLVALAYAFATAGVMPRALLDRMAHRLCAPVGWADARADAGEDGVGCIDLAASCTPSQLVRLAVAYAKLSSHTPRFFEAVSAAGCSKLKRSELALDECVWLAFAVGSSGYAAKPHASELLARLAPILCTPAALASRPPSHLCAIACAYTRAHAHPARAAVLGALVARLCAAPGGPAAELGTFQPRELSNLLWALATSGEGARAAAHALVRALLAEASARGPRRFAASELDQLFRSAAILNLEAPALALVLPAELERAARGARRTRAREASAADGAADGAAEDAAAVVSAVLRSAGVAHVREFCVSGTPFVVDLAFPGRRLAIELHGHHSHLQRGATDECKARLLRSLGWRVEAVGARAWLRLVQDGEAEQVVAMVRDLLGGQSGGGTPGRARGDLAPPRPPRPARMAPGRIDGAGDAGATGDEASTPPGRKRARG
jgi:very-short-patch-repair endonuclease